MSSSRQLSVSTMVGGPTRTLTDASKAKIRNAALFVADAVHGRHRTVMLTESIISGACVQSSNIYFVYHHAWWRRIVMVALFVQMAIVTSYEAPAGCFGDSPATKAPVMHHAALSAVNLICVLVFGADVALHARLSGGALLARKSTCEYIGTRTRMNKMRVVFWVKALCVFLELIDVFLSFSPGMTCRFSRVLRPIFLVARFTNIQSVALSTWRTLPKIANVLLLLIMHLVVCGFLASVIFRDYIQTSAELQDDLPANLTLQNLRMLCEVMPGVYGEQVTINGTAFDVPWEGCAKYLRISNVREDYYETMAEAIQQLFILLSTANYPDVMMPVYNLRPGAAVFFVYFLIVGLFFLMNLVLAVVYEYYKVQSQEFLQRRVARESAAFDAAFETLGEIKLTKSVCKDLLHRVRRRTTRELVGILYDVVNVEERDALTRDEFKHLAVQTLRLKLKKIPERPRSVVRLTGMDSKDSGARGARTVVLDDGAPKSFLRKLADMWIVLCLRIMARPRVEKFFDFLVMLSCAMYIIERHTCAQRPWDTDADPECEKRTLDLYRGIEGVFIAFFVGEMAIKITAAGFKGFWSPGGGSAVYNRIDLTSVTLSFVSVAIIRPVLENANDGTIPLAKRQTYTTVFMMIRIVRVVRVLRLLKQFGVVLEAAYNMVPVLLRMAIMVWLVEYFFVIVGMESFAGEWSPSTIKQSPYAQLNYYANTFDSFWVGMTTLFELIVVNNWHVIMSGAVEAHRTKWVRAYFFLNYALMQLVILNVVIAFIVDSFVSNFETAQKKGELAGERRRLQIDVDAVLGRREDRAQYRVEINPSFASTSTQMYGPSRDV